MRSCFAALLTTTMLVGVFCPFAHAQRLEGRVVEHTLDNGMKLILLERKAAPVVSCVIRYRVGSVDEAEGRTGLAHLYEHLAFRGTEIVGTHDYETEKEIRSRIDVLLSQRQKLLDAGEGDSKSLQAIERYLEQEEAKLDQIVILEELDQIYNLNGAVGLNATTSADLTTFMVDLPANRLPLWAALESDRMAHSVPRDFDVERSIVGEETRGRTEDPETALYREYLKTAFRVHPYGRPVSGWEGEIESVCLEDARGFYEAYYAPSNAVAAVVGDIHVNAVVALAETTFGRVPGRRAPADGHVPVEPRQTARRYVAVLQEAEPALFMGFHKPSVPGGGSSEDLIFELLIDVLTRGSDSRLETALFKRKQLAMDLASWIGPGDRYPNLFTIAARPIHPHTPEEVEEAIWVELEALSREPVPPQDLHRAKNHLSAEFLRGLRNNRGMAEALSYWEVLVGDWRYLERRLSLIESITPEGLQEMAARYLTRDNCTVAVLKTAGGSGDE